MKTNSILIPLLLLTSGVLAQYSTSDIRDAGSLGPYPFYVGVGYMGSLANSNLEALSSEFVSYYGDGNTMEKLRGIQILAGASIIPEDSRIAFLVEGKANFLARKVKASGNYFTLSSRQASITAGMRWVLIPQFLTVLQVQAGPVLYYAKDYDFNIDGTWSRVSRPHDWNNLFKEWHALVRISIMDPAGTEGGWGLFVEWGYNYIQDDDEAELGDAIRVFNPGYTGQPDDKSSYGYFSAGILLPIAVRIK